MLYFSSESNEFGNHTEELIKEEEYQERNGYSLVDRDDGGPTWSMGSLRGFLWRKKSLSSVCFLIFQARWTGIRKN